MHHLVDDNALSAVIKATEALCRLGIQASPALIAVVDASGSIMLVNAAWQSIAKAQGASAEDFIAVGVNYLDLCRKAGSDPYAVAACLGISGVLDGSLPEFAMTYPCHGPSTERWFRMNVAPLDALRKEGAIISHVDVTDHKTESMDLAELEASVRRSFSRLMYLDAMLPALPDKQDRARPNEARDASVEAAINAYFLACDMTDMARDRSFVLRHSTRLLSEILTAWAKTTGDLPFGDDSPL